MIQLIELSNGGFQVRVYRYDIHRFGTIGYLQKGSIDEDYWHFFPSAGCALNAGVCKAVSNELTRLNGTPVVKNWQHGLMLFGETMRGIM